ncbi:ABC transporter permease/substrate-binding protein [Candidatus Stoquefichus sp. SB1]|uniref:ABC transporter permease/substrate-binding protein n=1 Tax=Candidatus Stoquefichus sp. SB1 TaxID=1658109 RepID=UPI00067E8BFD|nr:glycine betaine ABC transporter substrate-binding protein [Candidatus Stoquefichus sp. SB1]
MFRELIQFYSERSDFFLPLILEHLQISMIAIIIATIIGISVGIFIAENKKTSPIILGIVSFLYTIPSISMLGFLIPITGIGNKSAIIALSIYALLPIIRNTYTGIQGVDKDILEAAKGMGSTRFQILLKIKLPLAFPVILSGFKNMTVMTIALAGIASFIGAGGLGVAIYRGITTNNITMTIAGSLAVAILAFLADFLIGIFERYIQNRHHSQKQKKRVVTALLVVVIVFSASLFYVPHQGKMVHIATKPMTEEFIIGEMMKLLIEDRTDIQVEMTKGVGGGTSNIHPAMVKGDFDIYPEYTGTSWSFVLKETTISDEETLYKQLVSQYEQQYQLTWLGLYGFNNTYGIAVTKQLADRYHLKTYSDLASISSQLIFGSEYDFYERDDGYNAMANANDFHFKKTVDLDIGLKYDALKKGEVDAIIAFTTDGQLSDSQIVLLEDDHHYFENYYAGTVIRQETLEKYPELKSVLMLLNNQISEQEMAKMNYQVETEKQNETAVAKAFLVKQGLLEESK